jgi:hypothetical protein
MRPSGTRENLAAALSAIMASVDVGMPVVAIDLSGSMDWGVITGYSWERKEFLCRTYDDPVGDYVVATSWPCVAMIVGKSAAPPAWPTSVLESLRIALALANTERFEEYASGFAAYDAWCGDLRDDERFESVDRERLTELVHFNAWSYISLMDARAAAARYLKSVRDEMGAAAAPHLVKAQRTYDRIAALLDSGRADAPFPNQHAGVPWTSDHRHREADTLEEVATLERAAVEELESAVAVAE